MDVSFLRYRENDITAVTDKTFTTVEDRFGELVTVELKEGGADIPVTEENKKEYVECVLFINHLSRMADTPLVCSAVIEHHVHKRVKEQFDAFMAGFSELIPQDLISVFDEQEIEVSWLKFQFQSLRPEALLSSGLLAGCLRVRAHFP